MKVITEAPVVFDASIVGEDGTFLNASGASRRAARKKRQAERKKKGTRFIDRVTEGVDKLRQTGLLNLGAAVQPGFEDPNAGMPPLPPVSVDEPKRMSTGAKIAIGVGIAAVLGLGIWYVVKKK